MTDDVQQPTNGQCAWRAGDRVEWGAPGSTGTLVAPYRGIDGEVMLCGVDHDGQGPAPLWHIRFDGGPLAGLEKMTCCERSILRRLP